MADNKRNQSSYASDENWDKNQGRYVDDNNYNQQGNYNSNMDLDRDRTIGDTGNYYGGTNYMGASSTNEDYNTDWRDGERRRQHDRNYQEFQGYGYQSKSDYNQNYQQYGNAGNQQRNQQSYNRNNEFRGRQDYNQQYKDYDDRRQWQNERYNKTSNQYREEDHPYYYGHVGGFGNLEDDQYNRQNYRSDYDNKHRGWNDYESRSRRQNYGNANRNYNRNRNEERSWWDKTRDEVSSWFGDENAERRRRQDERREGGYKGKGPKEYRRSDERIREDVCDRLSEDAYIDASDIEVRVSNGEVTLNGTVDKRNAKRRAEDIIESISGVSNVQNNLRVGQSMPVNSTMLRNTSIDVTNTRTDTDATNK